MQFHGHQMLFHGGAVSTGWMPFDFPRSRIMMLAEVAGKPATFLLDSGAEASLLDTSFAASAGIVVAAQTVFSDRGSVANVPVAQGVRIRLGSMELLDLDVPLIDLTELRRLSGQHFDLVLGREIFEQAIVDIDFPGRRIAISDPDQFEAFPWDDFEQVPLKPSRSGRGRVVDVSLEGGASVELEFDLGSPHPIVLQEPYWRVAGILHGRRSTNTLTAGVAGIREARLINLSYISVGSIKLESVDAVLENSVGELEQRLGAGLLGMPILSRFRIATHYGRDLLLMRTDSESEEPLPRNRSGLRVLYEGDALRVLLVAENGPAEATGWKNGDRIIAVNGRPVAADYWSSDISTWPEAAAGTTVHLTLSDNSVRKLTLSDYY